MKNESVIFIQLDEKTKRMLKAKAASMGMSLKALMISGALQYEKNENFDQKGE
jgi:hypothetical protein